MVRVPYLRLLTSIDKSSFGISLALNPVVEKAF
eukprot:CAMPEP_0170475050 /NCGR_PEP_ID=MMETSP0123-20130129/16786_1 /TAXON_ID=182087 /ORGANISM="Favella ehrenbergii, Strain Fehren 1" /LENGTH=32 /DNA_ID= /DNA_START= /DNA_END= /DNA_ORIENTATION=